VEWSEDGARQEEEAHEVEVQQGRLVLGAEEEEKRPHRLQLEAEQA